MTQIVINGEHCFDLQQLKRYLKNRLSIDSNIRLELLELGRGRHISQWLREQGEVYLADMIDKINCTDSEYLEQLCEIITGTRNGRVERVPCDKVLQIENVSYDWKGHDVVVSLSLKILSVVNENYEIKAISEWGESSVLINTWNYSEDTSIKKEITLHECADINLEKIVVTLEGIEIKRLKIEDFAFNDNCVNRKSAIKCKLKDDSENVEFVPFEQNEISQTFGHETLKKIIARVKVDGMYRFVDYNGDICTPDLCERVENDYYSCGFNFSNFYKKRKDYFYISSDGVKELGDYDDGIVLNERLIAVKDDEVWKILDKEGNVIPLPCQVRRIYGMNNQGSVFCKVISPKTFFRSSTTYFAFVNIHSGTIVKFKYDIYSYDSETDEIGNGHLIMSPYVSLVLIHACDKKTDFWCCFKTSVHKFDDFLFWDKCHILSDEYVCFRDGDIFDISKWEILHYISREPKFDYSGDLVFNKYGLGEGLFNIKTGNYISDEEFCYSFDNFYVTSKNGYCYLYGKDDDKALENAFEYMLPIKNDNGLYAFLKNDNRLIFINLSDEKNRVRKVISSSLPHKLDKGDRFIYTVNDSVINVCLLREKGEIYSYCLNCNGVVIAKDESGSNSLFAFDENTVHRLVNGDTIEICKKYGSVFLTLLLPLKCQVAIPCNDGYYLLSSDSSLYSCKNEILIKIGSINKRYKNKSICFTDDKQRYYETSKGIIKSDGGLLISENRLANYTSIRFFMNDDIIRDIRCSSDEICYGLELI